MNETRTMLAKRLDWVPARLAELLAHYRIPGGSVAVWHDGAEYETAAGLANVPARVEATPDTLFLIGSITKVYTASLVMGLVDEGLVELDTSVLTYLPEFRLSDADATSGVTVRQLLTHTSGIVGDHLPDRGRGDDAVELFVRTLADEALLHRPGALFSYCNSGFVVAGRLVERLTGQTWEAALRDRLLDPLESTGFATLPEEALRHRVAVGHAPIPHDPSWRVKEMWPEIRSAGPAGFTPMATGRDVLGLARLHLGGGLARSGARVLSGGSVAAMQEQEVAGIPSGPVEGDGWGLGWARYRYAPDERVLGHNGGRSAVLRVLPDRDFAITVLTNASGGLSVAHHLIAAVIGELFDISIPTAARTPAESLDLDRLDLRQYEGRYRHGTFLRRVSATEDGLVAEDDGGSEPAVELWPAGATRFLAYRAGSDLPARAAFLELHGSRYLHTDQRAFPREAKP